LFGLRPHRERPNWEQASRVFDDLVLPRARRSDDSTMEDLVAVARAWRPDLVLFEVASVHDDNRLPASASDEELPSVVTPRATLLPSGVAVSILVMGAPADLAGPLPAAFVVAGITVLVLVATAPTGRAGRRRPRNA